MMIPRYKYQDALDRKASIFTLTKIFGKIIGVHGRTGTLRVRFNRGVPGQALGTRVRIFE